MATSGEDEYSDESSAEQSDEIVFLISLYGVIQVILVPSLLPRNCFLDGGNMRV